MGAPNQPPMALLLRCLGLLLPLLLAMASSASADRLLPTTQHNNSIRIDCGGSSSFVDAFNESWVSDRFFTGGFPADVPGLTNATSSTVPAHERTLRYFPRSQGKENCYIVDLPGTSYYIRMFFVYGNYDNENHPPSFDVSVEGTVVFSWNQETWTENSYNDGAYSDLFASIRDGDATICFYSIGTDKPVIGALELVKVDPFCYDGTLNQDLLMVNYGRFTGGNEPFGSGLSMKDKDIAGRAWDADTEYTYSEAKKVVLTTSHDIDGSNKAPDFFPTRLYQACHTLDSQKGLQYLLPVDPRLDYMLWFHFAEIDPSISRPNERVFDILVNDAVVFRYVDVFDKVGKFAAYDLQYTARNLSNATLSITLRPLVGIPLICGIENYALLQKDASTNHNDVLALQKLKKSLQIPERMGWNGDPCAPSNWDAWEGITCNLGADRKSHIVSHLDLSNQGLQGFISVDITGLMHLRSLNLSNNLLKGTIPQGLGLGLLTQVDLSQNQLSGSIPASLSSSHLQTVLLDGNRLEGQVPEALYSIGVTGGYVNLSDNAGLCGVPSLPRCSALWGEAHQLSSGAKVGIAFAAVATIAIGLSAAYVFVQRKNREDYNFGLPHQLASKSARYQRQKLRLRLDSDDLQYATTGSGKFVYGNAIRGQP